MQGYSQDLLDRIVLVYKEGRSTQKQIAKRFLISEKCVSETIRRYKETQSTEHRPYKPGPPPKIDEESRKILKTIHQENPDATDEEYAKLLQEKTGISVHQTTMNRTLNGMYLTKKQKTYIASEQYKEKNIQKTKEFIEQLDKIPEKDRVYLDEAGCKAGMIRERARSLQNTRAVCKKSGKRCRNTTILGALTLDGLIAVMTYQGGTTKEVFRVFVKDVLIPQLRKGHVLIMDNLSVHHDAVVKQMLEAVGVRILFLPPYSPQFNPIEHCWSKLKSELKKQAPKDYEEIVAGTKIAVEKVTREDAQGWFANCNVFKKAKKQELNI